MTEATFQAFHGLRDLSTIKWYIIPLFALIYYVYVKEIKAARQTGNWDAVFAGAAIFGVDFFNETWNGWVLALTGRSAVWTVPGPTALRTLVGWNIEIMLMFAILGIIYYHTLSESTTERILGIPEKLFWAITYSLFCVFVECILNVGGHLIWEYEYWNLSFKGIWLIIVFGYLIFFLAAALVISLKTIRSKVTALFVFYTVPFVMNIYAFGIRGWYY